ncbi:MAG: penicillin-binding protein 2 [Candidatus Poriferisodalaceae bacterium]
MDSRLSDRLTFLGVVGVALFVAMITRLWFLQVLTSDELSVEAESNRIEVIIEPPTRGRILDRHGVVLAENQRTGVVTINSSRFTTGDLDRVLNQLSDLLDIPVATMELRLEDLAYHPLAAKVVATGLDEAGLLRVQEASLPGVEASWDMERVYPNGTLAAHVLGYVGAISPSEYSDFLEAGYVPSERVGRAGIEVMFEDFLHGTPGQTKLEVDAGGRVHRVVNEIPPEPGNDVLLSIDADLQAAVEAYLQLGLISARQSVSRDSGFFFPASAGAAVVMDLRNGDVLAMASHPTYDPNWLIQGLTNDEYQSVFENPLLPGPLNNRAVQGQYSPGSVFKLVTALGALEAGIISPRNTFYDAGSYTIPADRGCTGRCTFFNAGRVELGAVDLSLAITKSSDAYFYKIGDDLYQLKGPEQFAIQDMANQLGFGRPTGVQLPFEKNGRIGSPSVKAALFEENPAAYNPFNETNLWLPGDNINTAIGQGLVVVTPLQLANAYATFANGGTRFSPNIAEELISRSQASFGETVLEYNPRIVEQVEFPPGASIVREGLTGVTSFALRGTAAGAFDGWDHAGYGVVGKTGTSQSEGLNTLLNRPKEDSAMFVAWAPRHDPRYVVAVIMEEAGFGGDAAAPVARNIFSALQAYEQAWPDPQVAFIAPTPECPEIPEALRGDPAFTTFVPDGCPWGIQVPRANDETDSDGDGIPDEDEEEES